MQHYLIRYRRPDGTTNVVFRDSKQGVIAQRRWFRRLFPNYDLVEVTGDWVREVITQVLAAGGPALQRLQAKCQWEQMSLTAVVYRYGDPRHWAA